MPTGGDIIEITWNHPTLGSGVIYPKAQEDSTFDLGGFRTGDDANMINGAGQAIRQLNRVRWSFEVLVSWDMNVNLDLEKITALAGDPQEAEWTITCINGAIYSGTGSPVGDIQGNGNQSTFPFKVSGSNTLSKQA